MRSPWRHIIIASVLFASLPLVSAFGSRMAPSDHNRFLVKNNKNCGVSLSSASSDAISSSEPSTETKKQSVAEYLVHLHDTKATFDFCGGMMFQLVLSDQLRNHLLSDTNVQVCDAQTLRMHQMPHYAPSAHADNQSLFHGREIRQVPNAAGKMGFVLQLSLADSKDPEGWTQAEVDGYDGWGHDGGRVWRRGERLEREGYQGFRDRFGPDSFALHHRFYLHYDAVGRLWLSAEDGCEGTPAAQGKRNNPMQSLFGNLF